MDEPEPFFPPDGPQADTSRPSIFEVIADEQLRELFHPVVKYVLSVSGHVAVSCCSCRD
jgi:peroxin-12